jgi:hypothetical protein
VTSPETTPPAPSAVGLAVHTFDSPAGTFTKLAARPTVWLPIVLMIVVVALGQFAIPTPMLQQATAKALANVEKLSGKPLDPQVRATQMAKVGSTAGRLTRTASTVVVGLIFLAIVAGICKLIFGAGASEPIRFKQEFAVVMHANLVILVGGIITVFMIRTSGRLDAGVTLGFLAPSGFAHAYLGRLSVWGAWDVLLLAIGNKVLAKAKSLTGPLLILGALWLAINVPLAFLAKLGTGQ